MFAQTVLKKVSGKYVSLFKGLSKDICHEPGVAKVSCMLYTLITAKTTFFSVLHNKLPRSLELLAFIKASTG